MSECIAANGGARFALGAWNPSYFVRLKAFVAEAGRRDVVGGFNLSSSTYFDIRPGLAAKSAALWHHRQRRGAYDVQDGHTPTGPAPEAVQGRLVAQVAQELRDADNLYYEMINGPYARTGIHRPGP